MMTPMKWLFTSLIVIFVILFVTYSAFMQNITTRTTSEAEVLADSVGAGIIRSELNEDGKVTGDVDYVNIEELVANITSNLMIVQKNHPYQIKMDYVFLDKGGKITRDEMKVKGIQFKVRYVDERGNVKGTAERRLALNQLQG